MIEFARKTTPILVAIPFLLVACSQPRITVHDVPKDEPTNASVARIVERQHSRPPLEWIVPQKWKELPRSALNRGNYVCEGADGGMVAIAVSCVPGASGDRTRVVNEYRRSIGLQAIDPIKLDEEAEHFELYGLKANRYHISNPDDPSKDQIELLALVADSYTWFFTMKGEPAAVKSQLENFEKMLQSITPSKELTSQSANESAIGLPKLQYDAPDGWVPRVSDTTRIASLAIEKPGYPVADLAILHFEGGEEIHLTNLNRWRDQLGLDVWSAREFRTNAISHQTDNHAFKLYDFGMSLNLDESHGETSMVIAFLVREGSTWVFKLRGDALLLDTQRRQFLEFLTSVRFADPGNPLNR